MQGEKLATAYEVICGDARNLPDVSAFIETLNKVAVHPELELRTLFDTRLELIVTRAPWKGLT